jgi:hypothetical protein
MVHVSVMSGHTSMYIPVCRSILFLKPKKVSTHVPVSFPVFLNLYNHDALIFFIEIDLLCIGIVNKFHQ